MNYSLHCNRIAVALVSFILATVSIDGSAQDWTSSSWISLEKDRPFNHYKYFHQRTPDGPEWDSLGMFAMPQFRKEFALDGDKVSCATLYVSGLGHFEAFINGRKIGNHFLDPGWSEYSKEVFYVTFDVKDMLQKENTIGVMLGSGFYTIPNRRYHKIIGSMGAPKMRLVLEVTYRDGRTQRIVSDRTWKVCESAVTFSSIYGGEDFDASTEETGWKENGYDDSGWNTPLVSDFSAKMTEQMNDPLSVHSELKIVSITKNSKGWLYDTGQNFSGIFRISVKGRRGDKIRIIPAELAPDGITSQESSGGPCWYEYTIGKDNEEETWQPQFTYYGQRYFQIEGADPADMDSGKGLPLVASFTGLHTCAGSPEVGKFRCSNQLFNKIDEIVRWAIRSNMASVMTDCPHREKLGWEEQVNLCFRANEYNYRLINVYRNVLRQMASAQLENGCIPTIAPEYVRFENCFEDSPEWGSTLVILPWYIYNWYDDDSFIREYYPVMKRFIEYLKSRRNSSGIVPYGLGDWLSVGPRADQGVTAHLTYIQDLRLMSTYASMTGSTEDKEYYDKETTAAVDAFNSYYWKADKQIYDTNSETVNSMALALNVVPKEREEHIYSKLLESMKNRKYAIGVGEIAHPYLLDLLHSHGDDELIFKMHTQSEKPGYAFFINRGATSLTEAWDGGMSQNHFCLDHIIQWFYGVLAGISQDKGCRGWKNIVIRPHPVGDLTWIDCDFDSPSGNIGSHWKIKNDTFTIKVTVPAGVNVRIILPDGKEYSRCGGTGTYKCSIGK